MDILPRRLVCCTRNRTEKGIQQAIKNMEKETDIIEMIKLMRFFKLAIRQLMHEKRHRMELKERSRYMGIDPDGPSAQKGQHQIEDLKLLKLCHIMQKKEGAAGESGFAGLSKARTLDKFMFSNGEVQLTDGFYSSSQSDMTQQRRPNPMTIQRDQSSSSSI